MHALDSYRIHHPEAEIKDLFAAWYISIEIPADLALILTGRKHRKTTSRYYLSSDRRGLFVAEGGALVTYLRFFKSQKDFALQHWPLSEEPESEPPPPPVEPPPPKLPLSHPEGFSLIKLVIDPAVRSCLGSITQVKKALIRSKKLSSSMTDSWTITYILSDAETNLTLKVVIPHGGRTQVFLDGI